MTLPDDFRARMDRVRDRGNAAMVAESLVAMYEEDVCGPTLKAAIERMMEEVPKTMDILDIAAALDRGETLTLPARHLGSILREAHDHEIASDRPWVVVVDKGVATVRKGE